MRARHGMLEISLVPRPTWQSVEGMSQQQYYLRFLYCVGKKRNPHEALLSGCFIFSLVFFDATRTRHTIAQVLSCCAALNIWRRPLGRKDFHQHPWQGVNCAHTSFSLDCVVLVSLTPVFHFTITYLCVSDWLVILRNVQNCHCPFQLEKPGHCISGTGYS